MKKLRVVDYIIDKVYLAGAKHAFTVTGGGAMFLNDAIAAHEKMAHVCSHHEQASSMAAFAYAKYTGAPALVCPTTGCGSTNVITGLLSAWQDSVPVVFISGNVNLHQISPAGVRNLGVQEANIIEIVKPITKYAKLIESVNEVEDVVEEALRLAVTGRPGPVWIDVPMNIQGKEMPAASLSLIEILKKSQRPLILAGGGICCSQVSREAFKNYISKVKIPVVTTFNAIDLIESNNPYFVGRVGIKGTRAGNFAMQNSDLLLVLGSRLAVPVTGYDYKTFARGAKIIVIDIDKVEHAKNTIKIDKFIHSDAKSFINYHKKLVDDLGGVNVSDWHDKCLRWKKLWPIISSTKSNKDGIDLYDFVGKLNAYKPDESVVIADAGSAYYVCAQATEIKKNNRYITSSAQAEMGFTVPACVGAAFAGSSCVIGVTGDGSMQTNIQELQTISHHNLPIKLFVWNNNGYLSIRTTQKKFFEGREIGTDQESGISFPSLEKIAKAYNINYVNIADYEALTPSMSDIFKDDRPMLIEVICKKWQEIIPTVQSKKNKDGTLVSAPLEDMYPFLSHKELADNMIIDILNSEVD
ncbi:MAG: thiamine pyrophosphate-binding protein [Pseudomonadota bacterium]|nr:thiamine pyrophosphate-binding protein [Pseudomonadota bacterium]